MSTVVPAHAVTETIHLRRNYEPHHARRGDPEYPMFRKAKRRLKRLGLWQCTINNGDCTGRPTLHHSHVEFAYASSVTAARLFQMLGLHLPVSKFAAFIEQPGNLEVLCEAHHLPGYRFAIHDIPAADWDIVRAHTPGLVPVEVYHLQ